MQEQARPAIRRIGCANPILARSPDRGESHPSEVKLEHSRDDGPAQTRVLIRGSPQQGLFVRAAGVGVRILRSGAEPVCCTGRLETIFGQLPVRRDFCVRLEMQGRDQFRQAGPGWSGPCTDFHRKVSFVFVPDRAAGQAAVAYDERTDGADPLLNNGRKLSAKEVLKAHKRKPRLEERFEQSKSVFEIARVLLESGAGIQARAAGPRADRA